jgi:hypothetical protein
MVSKDWSEFEKNIAKTGFVLENSISALMRKSGWTVINNKYYIDDVQPAIREIDIVSYKARIFKEFNFYTVLIISCKKSTQNLWALLCKDKDEKDPNINWHPIHIWTNNKVHNYVINQGDFRNEYLSKLKHKGVFDKIFDPSSQIFAFQEMNKERATIQNDKQIFSSITSLMKAQGYEIDSLERRKTEPCVYQFNLLSVIDTELIEMFFDDKGTRVSEIEEAKYIGNYIINNQETCAKIHFIVFPAFEKFLSFYDLLHECNLEFFEGEYEAFFDDALSDFRKTKIFLEEFGNHVLGLINLTLRQNHRSAKIEGLYLDWDEHNKAVRILIDGNQRDAEVLNANQRVKEHAIKTLKRYYRYDGDVYFLEFDVPF